MKPTAKYCYERLERLANFIAVLNADGVFEPADYEHIIEYISSAQNAARWCGEKHDGKRRTKNETAGS